jgi:hypothetical protein
MQKDPLLPKNLDSKEIQQTAAPATLQPSHVWHKVSQITQAGQVHFCKTQSWSGSSSHDTPVAAWRAGQTSVTLRK